MRIRKHFYAFHAVTFICGIYAATVWATEIYFGPNDGIENRMGDVVRLGKSVGDGLAVGYGTNAYGKFAVRWGKLSSPIVVLDGIGVQADGRQDTVATAMNNTGLAVGDSAAYAGRGVRAVKWNFPGAKAVELESLSNSSSGISYSHAVSVNDKGVIVGASEIWRGQQLIGTVPVRWSAQSTTCVELDGLGRDSSNRPTRADICNINANGDTLGTVDKYQNGEKLGTRAVIWSAQSTRAQELRGLGGADDQNPLSTVAVALNNAGTVVGYAEKKARNGRGIIKVAVKWKGVEFEPEELSANGSVVAINSSGTIVGAENGQAVIWRQTSNTPARLTPTDIPGRQVSACFANDINASDMVAGSVTFAHESLPDNKCAVVWRNDGSSVDLNSLIDPKSGWKLLEATSISDSNWVTGVGVFNDPAKK